MKRESWSSRALSWAVDGGFVDEAFLLRGELEEKEGAGRFGGLVEDDILVEGVREVEGVGTGQSVVG